MSSRQSRRIPLNLRGLSGREELFRISTTLQADPAIDAWLNGDPAELRSIARKWFMQMRRCGADVRELLHDGCPVACVADVPFAYVNSFKAHVNVGFFQGAMLEDPAGLLEGSGKRMRHVKLAPAQDTDATALGDLIRKAYVYIKTRLAAEQATDSD